MIPGIGGTLVSGGYLSQLIEDSDATGAPAALWARDCIRWWRAVSRDLGPASAPRAVFDVAARPLVERLGFGVLDVTPMPWGLAAAVAIRGRRLAPLACTAWGAASTAAWRHAVQASLSAGLPWALVFNGASLVVADATTPWIRRALEVDFAAACLDRRALAAAWRLLRADALGGREPGSLADHAARSEAEGEAVCAALGAGVLEALGELVRALDHRPRPGSPHAVRAGDERRVFDQSLTIAYRLLFLFFAEARQLVPTWHEVYREAYGTDALVRRALAGAPATGTWATVQAMSRLAHAGCEADDLRVTAFNGRLFAPARTPLGERRHVPDAAAARAVLALGTTRRRGERRRIAFHDLGVEQLGAVYERVLDFEPVRRAGRLELRPTAADRKTSGSFYTPRPLTDFLVRRTLAPLVEGRTADEIFALRILDPAMGSGAFLVSACRFLGERAEQALARDGAWREGDASEGRRAEIVRTVAERCLYGIDLNPTAVQLARLSLWLCTLAADRPLTFLDHHLAVGNSLIGARLSDLASAPGAGTARRPAAGDQPTLFGDDALAQLARSVVPDRLRLALAPSTTPADVRDKERRLERLLRDGDGLGRWSRAADLWCGLALAGQRVSPGVFAEMQRLVAGVPVTGVPAGLGALAAEAQARARAHGACHWELLFPEVFLDGEGRPRPRPGFDAVLGNPPWEMIRADTGSTDTRDDQRRQGRALLRFVRASGQYRLQGVGQANHYQLFAERALDALRPGGRLGLILPGGIQLDTGSSHLRRRLLDTCDIDTWLAFDNRKGIFPVHRSQRFVIVGATAGGVTRALPLRCGLDDAEMLARLPDDPGQEDTTVVVRLKGDVLRQWDPEHLAVPAVRTPMELAIACRALASPRLSDRHGWDMRFGRELNATDDRAHFADWPAGSSTSGRDPWLPVVDGRHLRPFGLALDGVRRAIRASAAGTVLGGRSRVSAARVCYRDVASATNRLTLIAARLPAGVTATHTVFTARRALGPLDTWLLLGLLNSLTANFLVRLQMTTHVTTTLMARLPVPRPEASSPEARQVAALARLLGRASTIDEAPAAYAHLNVLAARAYGLTRDEYTHVVGTFPLLGVALTEACLDAWPATVEATATGPGPHLNGRSSR